MIRCSYLSFKVCVQLFVTVNSDSRCDFGVTVNVIARCGSGKHARAYAHTHLRGDGEEEGGTVCGLRHFFRGTERILRRGKSALTHTSPHGKCILFVSLLFLWSSRERKLHNILTVIESVRSAAAAGNR